MPASAKKPAAKAVKPVSLREVSQIKRPATPSAGTPAAPAAPKLVTGGKTAPTNTVKPAKPEKADKPDKVVRDGFSMPKSDYRLIGQLKERALTLGVEAKKSEILRAGVKLLSGLDNGALLAALKSLESVKTGRRKK